MTCGLLITVFVLAQRRKYAFVWKIFYFAQIQCYKYNMLKHLMPFKLIFYEKNSLVCGKISFSSAGSERVIIVIQLAFVTNTCMICLYIPLTTSSDIV